MADKGILFSAPMVKALLAGRKSQTRRLCAWANNPLSPALTYIVACDEPGWFGDEEGEVQFKAPYAPGDRLYVREHWKTTPAYDDLAPSEMGGDEPLLYLSDDATFNWAEADGYMVGKHRQAMHMPRWASRLTLSVTDVRVQRLQEISEADCYAEGIMRPDAPSAGSEVCARDNARNAYRALWNSLHTKPGETWADDPWIVAVAFNCHHGNIDNV